MGAGMSLGAMLSRAVTRVTSKAAAWELEARARKVRAASLRQSGQTESHAEVFSAQK